MNTIKKAVEHFIFKLDPKNNIWKASEADGKAITQIVKFVEDKHEEQLRNNQLFAKLYITYYGELLKYYKASIFDKEPQKDLHKTLDTPLETIIDTFRTTLKDIEIANTFEVNGSIRHPLEWSEQDKANIKMKKVNLIPYQEAEDNLTAMINLALNTFK